ncbi:MAG: hypothetical protein KDE26_21240 [Bacteroidetes bacterium]|nr:hypothetical protein [Bacteroidota bacterium]MCB0845795.1 hypothetical protein [Bacteroidota bacterium]
MKDFDEHKDELKNAPFLDKMKRKNVFEVPENYFSEMAEDWKDKAEDEAIMEETRFLKNIEKKNIFQVPEAYFDQLPGKIAPENQAKPKIRLFWRNPAVNLSIAASIVILISLGIWGLFNRVSSQEADPSTLLSEVPTEILLASVDVSEYDINMIVETMGEEALKDWTEIQNLHLDEEEVSDLLDHFEVSDLEAALLENPE